MMSFGGAIASLKYNVTAKGTAIPARNGRKRFRNTESDLLSSLSIWKRDAWNSRNVLAEIVNENAGTHLLDAFGTYRFEYASTVADLADQAHFAVIVTAGIVDVNRSVKGHFNSWFPITIIESRGAPILDL